MKYVLNRLKERSTWLGLVALAGAIGYSVDPFYVDTIVSFGVAAAGLVMALTRDNDGDDTNDKPEKSE